MSVNQGRRRQRLISSIGICIALMGLALLGAITPFTSTARAASNAPAVTPTPTTPPIVRPTVNITSPAPFATFAVSKPIQIVAAASISSGNITRVEFQAEPNSGTNPIIALGTDTSAPYSIIWNNAPAGAFVLNVTAYSDGPYATSTFERIAITPDGLNPFPMVNITSPGNGAQFVSPATIHVGASVTLGSGTITRVDFTAQGPISYQGTAASAPYGFTWSDIYPGTYTISAVAYANTSIGVVGNTVSIQVTVTSGPPPGGCLVQYTVTQFTGGFLASIGIINASSTTINGWKLVFTFPATQQVLSGFNGVFTQTGNQVTIANASWNGTIISNGIVSGIGFNGSWSGSNPSPTDFKLNGVSCRVI